MIAFIKGTVAAYGADWIIVDNNGIGWQLAYAHSEDVSLNQEIRVYAYMSVTENDVSLYGFSSQEEKELFLRLISVKGLGPKTAMNMFSKAGYEQIIAAVEAGNVNALKKLPGIGGKTASQIVLDLKGKLVAVPVKQAKLQEMQYPKEVQEALEGLKNLGYKSSELNPAANIMLENPGLSTAEYLRMGLRAMNRNGG